MSRARNASFVALILGGLVVVVWFAGRRTSAPRGAPEDAVSGSKALAPLPHVASERVEPVPDPSSLPRAGRSELRGIVRAADGTPIPGARVWATRPAFRGFDLRGGAGEDAPEHVAEVESDERGEFRVALAAGDRVDLEASLEGLCSARAVDRGAGDFVELALLEGLRVRGRITRARDGSPVARALVTVASPGALLAEAVSAEDGTYSMRVASADARLRVDPHVEQPSLLLPLRFDAEGSCVLDVAVEDGVRVEGRVSDRDTGRPLRARIHMGRVGGRAVNTDERGEYALTGFGNPDLAVLFATALTPGYATARGALGTPVDGRMRVDFELVRGRTARGRVVDERSSAVERARVLAVGEGRGNEDWRTVWTKADGSFTLEDLAPELRHALLIAAPGFASQVHDFPADELARTELDLGKLVLRAPHALRGRVVDETGHGLARVTVSLDGWNADRFALAGTGAEPAGLHYVEIRERASDADGRFAFEDLAPGSYVLDARSAGRPPSPAQRLEIADADLETEIVLAGGRGISGVALDEQGRPLASIHVNLRAEELRDPAASLDERSLFARTGSDGAFEFTGLPAGLYALELFPMTYSPEDLRTPLLATSLVHVAADGAPLRVELQRGLTIEGVLRDGHGAALADHSVSAVGPKGESGWTATTDAEGRFAMPVARGTTWTLEVYGPRQLEGAPLHSLSGVAAGTLDVWIELP